MRTHPLHRTARASIVSVALLLTVTACGGGSTGEESPTSPSAAQSTSASPTSPASQAATTTTDPVCADAAALRASLEALTKVQPLQDGTDALKSAMADVRTDLDAVTAGASSTLAPDVEQVKTAFAGLETATAGLSSDTLREKAPAIAAALKQVVAATSALGTTLTTTCPTS